MSDQNNFLLRINKWFYCQQGMSVQIVIVCWYPVVNASLVDQSVHQFYFSNTDAAKKSSSTREQKVTKI